MNKKQIETLLHYVTIAMEQANKYKEVYDLVSEHGLNLAKQPLSQEEIDNLEAVHCDLELQLKKFDLPKEENQKTRCMGCVGMNDFSCDMENC